MEYRFGRSGEACAGCNASFEVQQSLHSMIVLAEERPSRSDWCEPCFAAKTDKDAPEVFAHWRTRKLQEGRARRQVDFATLRELFFRMIGRSGAEYAKLAYMLALLLLRKRFLKLQEFASENGVDYLVITAKQRAEPMKIEAPELQPQDFEALRDRLRVLLDFDVQDEIDTAFASPRAGDDDANDGSTAAD
jgi:hypothetical protein